MESLWERTFNSWVFYEWELIAEDWFFLFAMMFFGFELIVLTIRGRMSWNLALDSVTNFVTLLAHLGLVTLFATLYLWSFYWAWELAPMPLPNTLTTLALCILACDLAYYWEHRMAHQIGVGWATHTVHHSSPHFNISVAYRHGPLDAIFGLPFLLVVVLLGFDPLMVLLSAALVQLYQTALHTESIGRLPRVIEAVLNTPSHHRVHHGSNPQYIDKNYAGILIIWDKLFGTFAREQEKVVYGVLPPIGSNNPLVVLFHGFSRLGQKVGKAQGLGNKLACLVRGPGWQPKTHP
ncbi:sterol desaturase family protein [Ferrimonas futtsuensis]|uniref:sterol desaturase family protein n=1 Tax=Ferrimonas futtsuensis TaxID=364764 RepID=UPI000406F33E|nr:sterol desaturase family protein [Ferrimonas futtsuensis]